MGMHIFGTSGIRKSGKQGFKSRKNRGQKLAPAVVVIFDSWLTLNSVLEITMTFAKK